MQNIEVCINNYRSIKKAQYKISLNKINYIIGSNESGKSNLLKALRYIGANRFEYQNIKNKTDQTKNVKEGDFITFDVKKDNIQNVIEANLNQIIFTEKNIVKYKKMIDRIQFQDYANYKNSKLSEKQITSAQNNNLSKYVDLLREYHIFKPTELEELKKIEVILFDKSSKKDSKLKLSNKIEYFNKQNTINLPYFFFIEPFIKGSEETNIRYKMVDFKKEDTIFKQIITVFGDDSIKKVIKNEIYRNHDDPESASETAAAFKKLNKKLNRYFKKFSCIKASPQLNTPENGNVTLFIEDFYEYKYTSANEHERSLGYKYFLRIILELIAWSRSEREVVYMIDEPETSLHPYLQYELLNNIEEILKNSKNITVIFATHSPYMIKQFELLDEIEDQIFWLYRKKAGDTAIKAAPELVKHFYSNPPINDNLRENDFLYKIIFDGFYQNRLNKYFKKTLASIRNDETLNPKEREEKILKLFYLKDLIK